MIKGTTTHFKFVMPCECSELDIITITFWQDNYYGPSTDRRLPIVKVKEQCDLTTLPKTICVTLNQEETLRFSEDRKAYAQLRATATDGTGYATKEQEITVYPVYDDSVTGDTVLPTPSYDGIVILDGMTIGGV